MFFFVIDSLIKLYQAENINCVKRNLIVIINTQYSPRKMPSKTCLLCISRGESEKGLSVYKYRNLDLFRSQQ